MDSTKYLVLLYRIVQSTWYYFILVLGTTLYLEKIISKTLPIELPIELESTKVVARGRKSEWPLGTVALVASLLDGQCRLEQP